MAIRGKSRNISYFSKFSDEELLSDKLFFASFYIGVGFLPPLVGIFGHNLVQLPLVAMSLVIIVRFFLRKDCRVKMYTGLHLAGVKLLLLFFALVFVYAIYGAISYPDRLRLLGKPAVLFLAVVLLLFVWTHQKLLDRSLFFRFVLYGLVSGLAITMAKSLLIKLNFEIGIRQDPSYLTKFLNIDNSINDELKIISVLAIGAALGFSTNRLRYLVLLIFVAGVLFASSFAAGFSDYVEFTNEGGSIYRETIRFSLVNGNIYSETVQFGIPLFLLTLALSYWQPKIMTNIVFGALTAVLVLSPWLYPIVYRLIRTVPLPRASEMLVRGEIWDGVAHKILENPIIGFGVDSLRYMGSFDLKNDYMPTDSLMHPHNMFLQLWLDLGFLGVSVVVAMFFVSWRFVKSLHDSLQPVILAGVVMISVFALVSNSIWQTWSIALVCFFFVYASFQNSTEIK